MSEPTIWDIAMGGKPPEKFVPYEEYKKLETENARLKADVNELADGLKLASEVGIKMADEVTRLKAEVERLTAFTTRTIIPNEELQKQVERLTKAGDAMVGLLEHMDVIVDMDSDHPEVEAWNAAKEGKPRA
jgi:hypothetical protein